MDGNAALAVLGLCPGASLLEIKAAYRRLAKRDHPDAAGSPETFHRLRRAYQVASREAPRPATTSAAAPRLPTPADPRVAPLPAATASAARSGPPPAVDRWLRSTPGRPTLVDRVDVQWSRRCSPAPAAPRSFEHHLALALAG